MIERKTFELDGISYELEQLPAKKGIGTLITLTKLLSEPIVAILSTNNISGAEVKSLLESDLPLDSMFQALTLRLNTLEVQEVIDALLTGATADGKKIVFDVHFAGKYIHLGKLLFEAVKFNYGNFSAGAQ